MLNIKIPMRLILHLYLQIIRKIARYVIPSCSALNETNKTYLNIKIHIGNV
jgi:hypothetical protein